MRELTVLNLFKKVRIDRLFFSSFAVFITALLLIFTWISYSFTSRELAENTSFYQQDLLGELNKQLDIQLRSIEQMSLAASRNIDTIGFDPLEKDSFERLRRKKDLLNMLANITYSTTMVQSIYLYTDTPELTDSQAPVRFLDLRGIKEESWYPEIQKNDFTWIADHMIQTNTGPQHFIGFARKVYNNSGKYYGLLVLNIKASAIEQLVRGETEGRSRILLDAGGKTISSIGNPVLSESELASIRAERNKSGSVRLPAAEGREDVLLVWNKTRSDWMLVETTPWSSIVTGSVRLAYVLITVGLSAIFIASFFTLFLSRQFTKPIRHLLAVMGGVPASTSISNLPTDYTNEFGNMFNGYRRQMERIEELLESLKEQHKRQREAEIHALQAMINPHFLYNTLDQLNWLAIESGQEKISEILSLMGKMFRIGLSNGETMIPVTDELLHADCYLQIQKVRWGERLSYTIHVDEEVKSLLIPRMTLQPFIENAIIHGFHGRRSGHIAIYGLLRDQHVEFRIEDNGAGLRDDWNTRKKRKTGGYGIRNVKDRIDAFWGAPYGVKLENREQEGTRVTIILPITMNRQEEVERYDVEGSHCG
ncbi:sensor histidine kinase [Paenibacillus sp. OAS669]|uniref:cache domain-containing sensor histidine kinase n=1 Tax=Paenibacillus sp. OAS669 TaxID=2663821 RepID=UPI001789BE8C|nr:sensor histidine kinase [Paenibacillus sp. OAS669]MBE1444960.1 two-component system sensor histidine kinase YesM [Paenibacillus sp. OAS669]